MTDQYTPWCRRLMGSLMDGGVWGVPRSGLVFTKRGNALVLTARMPHVAEMPITAAQLAEQQQGDYEENKQHFEAAGFEVRDESESGRAT
jgi:hypothetical protein